MELAARSSVVVGAGISAGNRWHCCVALVTGARCITRSYGSSDGNSLVPRVALDKMPPL